MAMMTGRVIDPRSLILRRKRCPSPRNDQDTQDKSPTTKKRNRSRIRMDQESYNIKELDDASIQEKIDHEVKIRDGLLKMTAAINNDRQVLDVAKNMLTINARIMALMSMMQRHRSESISMMKRKTGGERNTFNKKIKPCKGKVSVSDIRIPLMWKDYEHFRAQANSETCNEYFVFCLLKCDGQVSDTSLHEVDETATDICFEDVIIFDNVDPDFKLEFEIYYTTLSEPKPMIHGVTPHRKTIRKQNSVSGGPKYILAGHAQLTVDNVHDKVKTLDLRTGSVGASLQATHVSAEESDYHELALWGQFCCRLAARPKCMDEPLMSGYVDIQTTDGGQSQWTKLWCILDESAIKGYTNKEDSNTEEPVFETKLRKGMGVADGRSPTLPDQHIFILSNLRNHEKEPVFLVETEEEYKQWKELLEQTLKNVAAWKNACEEKLELAKPIIKKLTFSNEHTSLYDAIEVTLSPEEHKNTQDFSSKQFLGISITDTTPVKSGHDVWQRRMPKKIIEPDNDRDLIDGEIVHYETTI